MADTDTEAKLCRYIDLRLRELEKRLEVTLAAKDTALTLSSASLEKRLETMNEFRVQIKDERSLFLPRAEYLLQHDRVVGDIRELRESRATLEGKASQTSVIITLLVGVTGIVLSVISLLH
jgi:hypothetical protein